MADSDCIELQGNEVILKAAEWLRMLPEWKAKPGKFRSGHVDYGDLIARHLVNLYCQLEGKPLAEKIELFDAVDPIAQEREERAKDREDQESLKRFFHLLNAWHLELSQVQMGMRRVIGEVDDGDFSAIGHVLNHRFFDLVENCPFPDIDDPSR